MERLSFAGQRRALSEPVAEGMLKNLWKLLKYDNYIMLIDEDKNAPLKPGAQAGELGGKRNRQSEVMSRSSILR